MSSSPLSALLHPLSFPLSLPHSSPLHHPPSIPLHSQFPPPSSLLSSLQADLSPGSTLRSFDTRSRHYPDTAPTPRHSDTSVNRHLTPTLGPTLRQQCQAISTVDLLGQCQWCQDKTDIPTLDTPDRCPDTPRHSNTPTLHTLKMFKSKRRSSKRRSVRAKDAQGKNAQGKKRSEQKTLRIRAMHPAAREQAPEQARGRAWDTRARQSPFRTRANKQDLQKSKRIEKQALCSLHFSLYLKPTSLSGTQVAH